MNNARKEAAKKPSFPLSESIELDKQQKISDSH